MSNYDRRRFLLRSTGLLSTVMLAGCDQLSQNAWFRPALERAEGLTERLQRFLMRSSSLAREYSEADLSPEFRANGSTNPDSAEYRAHVDDSFANWSLKVGGLVDRPMSFSLNELRNLPSRTQITRHDCVEGWSCIGKWKGVQLSTILDKVGLQHEAKYILFRCADALEQTLDGSGQYYESIAREDAFHPQTILAYEMNNAPLPIAHGAPLRLRLERQLGYKMAKYIMKIEALASFADIGGGKGGYWEDRGYEWYAGI
jgi:DMSO/TMAO reductase YedYZ molybdopterin-dependent catalytic subunit